MVSFFSSRIVILAWVSLCARVPQSSAQLSCPSEWTLYRQYCYKLYVNPRSWSGALDVCKIDGAQLVSIRDRYANTYLGTLAAESSVTSFWIGLNRLHVTASNITFAKWSDGTGSSIYQAFWSELQPDLSAGDCVHVALVRGHYRWAFSTCEWKKSFICQFSACPTGSFHCLTNECIALNRVCDGAKNCIDGSDEVNCSARCKEYLTGSSGFILSPNFPWTYSAQLDCQWTIEGPLYSNILLQLNSFDTEMSVDEVVVFGGGKTAFSSYTLARLSGTISTNPPSVRSPTNFMTVWFYSSDSIQFEGFNLTWTAVTMGIPDSGQILTAYKDFLTLFPQPYLANQESVWIIQTPSARTILTLELQFIDLEYGDYVYVRDGKNASAPLLAKFTNNSGPLHVFSTGPQMYILMKTGIHTAVTKRGFSFLYRTGCRVVLSSSSGEIFSPGYGVVNYPNFVTCTYQIKLAVSRRITLRFDPLYDIDYNFDFLQAFLGENPLTDNPVHNNSGFSGSAAPSPITSFNGRIYVQFLTNAISNRLGFHGTYSLGCTNPMFNSDTLITPSVLSYDYGVSFNVSCPDGFVFNSMEFITQQQDKSFVAMDTVQMECLFGGFWNVRRIPQCVRKYCGQAPKINNGYASANGAVFGSTATYTCNENYAMTGNQTIICQSNSTWQPPPICSVITCPPINTNITHLNATFVASLGITAGSVVVFSCHNGYDLIGSPIAKCNASGMWSHPVPSCKSLKCHVPVIDNGRVNTTAAAVDFDTTLLVSCNSGYMLRDPSVIRCLANQSFDASPVCIDVDECTNSLCPDNTTCTNVLGSFHCPCQAGFENSGTPCADINECSKNNGGCSDTCENILGSYRCTCPQGYTLFSQNGTMGYVIPPRETGTRLGDTYYINHTCVPNQCSMPPKVVNGYLTEYRKWYHFMDTLTVHCLLGYNLTGESTLTCQANGSWSVAFPTCQIAKCLPDVLPSSLVNPPVQISPGGFVDYGSKVTITCNIPGRGIINKSRTCVFNPTQQKYMLQGDTYECGVIDCGEPIMPKGGLAIPKPTHTTFNSTFMFFCDEFHRVERTNRLGTNIITCTSDAYWTFYNITCIPLQCPDPGVPPDGMAIFSNRGYGYHNNVSYTCLHQGFEPKPTNNLTCGVAETGNAFSWDAETPHCVDVMPPTFLHCPESPFLVNRYSSVNFTVPVPRDNVGVASFTVSPAYFFPTQPISENLTVTYVAKDYAGLSAVCSILIIVQDENLTTNFSAQCSGNSFAVNSTVCQPCPNDMLALPKETPLSPSCLGNGTEGPSCSYTIFAKVVMLSRWVEMLAGSVEDCISACNRLETIHFISTKCIGFNYNRPQQFCFLYTTESVFQNNSDFDFYQREVNSMEAKLTACYCAPPCPAGTYSKTGFEPDCILCPSGFISAAGSSLCQECLHGQTNVAGNTIVCQDAVPLVCSPNPCQNGGNCSVLLHDAFCNCLPGFTGLLCEQTIDFCTSSPCYNNGTCSSDLQGFQCRCPSGFSGHRCEVNNDDCHPDSCSGHGTCINGVNAFTCICVENYTGLRCEHRLVDPCKEFPCSVNSTCISVNSIYRTCNCFPDFTGPLCEVEINECLSEPCLNGGICHDKVNGFECSCTANFTGNDCQQPQLQCSSYNCGVADQCVDDQLTGLPLCICKSGYNQGKLCQYSFTSNTKVSDGIVLRVLNLSNVALCRLACDQEGSVCAGFVFDRNSSLCTMYEQISVSTNKVNGSSLARKRCFYPVDVNIYTEWFNTMSGDMLDMDMESYTTIQMLGMRICEDTQPIGVECRVSSTGIPIPAGVSCSLTGLSCNPGQLEISCPDMEIRYKCARSRVFAGRICSIHDICSENNSCIDSTCVNDPDNLKGFHCLNCKYGYIGDRCQLGTDECASYPCQNNATCIDEFKNYTCICPKGYAGNQCEVNKDDCQCNAEGTSLCIDGLDDYTCVCSHGYIGRNCSVNVDDCANAPCLHDGTCIDQVNGYNCTCVSGWTGFSCETMINFCQPLNKCFNGGTCIPLFNGFTCSCPVGVFGPNCEYVDSLSQCQRSNPCISPSNCSINGSQAVCQCNAGMTGSGCEVYADNNCASNPCQNGATCSVSSNSLSCKCVPGFEGNFCEINTNECVTKICPALATCVDSTHKAFCRCPLGNTGQECLTNVDTNYDICFFPSLTNSGAALPYTLPVTSLQGFTITLWVRYNTNGSQGTFLTMYTTRSMGAVQDVTKVLHLDHKGMYVNIFHNQTLTYTLFPINDGLWHFLAVFWNSFTGDLDLTVDYLHQDQQKSYGTGQRLTTNLWFELGEPRDRMSLLNSFQGCVSRLNVLNHGISFSADLPSLQTQPSKYLGNLLRWAEFEVHGNTQVKYPSTVRLNACSTNLSESTCLAQTKVFVALKSCPDDFVVATIYPSTPVQWIEPVFSGHSRLSQNHQPGELFGQGSTTVVYVGEDLSGNTATCTFTIFVSEKICPALTAPRGGGQQVCEMQAADFNACSASCLAPNSSLVTDIPHYYSCGPDGQWETLNDFDGLYPTCGRVVSLARANVYLHMSYQITAGQCATIAKSVSEKIRQELVKLTGRWGESLCNITSCANVVPDVNCTSLSSTSVNLVLGNVSSQRDNGVVNISVENLFLTTVLDEKIFNIDSIVPGAVFDSQSFTVQITYVCETGQAVRGKECVECGPGTYYNTSTLQCHNCPVGQYVSGFGAISCTVCPPGQTTSAVGSVELSQCSDICPLGYFFNWSSRSCEMCALGFYQDETGQFKCKPCDQGQLTRNEGSTSFSDCSENCLSGYELLVNKSCAPCPAGSFRQSGVNHLCVPCPAGYTTPSTSSVSMDNCTVRECKAGYKVNATGTGCEPCPLGQFQPVPNQAVCLPCHVNFTTAQTGSISESQCLHDCPSGFEVNVLNNTCMACRLGTYREKTKSWACQPCPVPFTNSGLSAISIAACNRTSCSPGSYFDVSQLSCVLCPFGTYQTLANQHFCVHCPDSLPTTLNVGSIAETDCISFCQSAHNNCSINAKCIQIKNSMGINCTCNQNYEGNGFECTHVCDNPQQYCHNGGTCSKDTNKPCICLSQYTGGQCQTLIKPPDRVAIIVGTVIGVLAFLLLLLVIIIGLLARWRRNSRSSNDNTSTLTPRLNTQGYQPFNPDPWMTHTYDPAYYNAKDVSFVSLHNPVYI